MKFSLRNAEARGKPLSALLVMLLFWAGSSHVKAQSSWVKFTPPGTDFSVQLPQKPTGAIEKISSPDLSVDGNRYSASDGETIYTVWFLKRTTPLAPKQSYLDLCADLVWDRLLQAVRDALPKDKYVYAHMDYVGEITDKDDPGREYSFQLDKTSGLTNFYVDHEKIYVLV